MNFDFSDFSKGLTEFKNFFTFKHITVLVFVAAILVLLCAPHSDSNGPVVAQTCSDASCPFPRKDAGTLPKVLITKVADDNWQIDLPGEEWEVEDPSQPEQKMVRLNREKECMVLLIKEPTNDSFGQYVIESIEGYNMGGASITSIKQVTLKEHKFVLLEGTVLGVDGFMAWNGIKDGFGYSLSCFYHPGDDAGTARAGLCTEIAESLQIK